MLDAPIQLEEIHIAVGQLNVNKVPGCDGLPIEFYRKYWNWLAKPLKMLFNKNIENGVLHISARDGIISLLDKPSDPLLVKNWRPLTLLNTDYKLYTKVLANRLQHVLPYLISTDQTGYIKGRTIADNTLDLLAAIQYCQENMIPSIAISVDFHKMFDSVQFNSIDCMLRAFNFSDMFIQMVKLCQAKIRCAVINNGVWSSWIPIQAGVQQGDPLAGLIAILILEIISLKIRQNDNIVGIQIGSRVKKLDQYVDDLWNIIYATQDSFSELIHEYSEFEDFAGLTINYDKTEVLRLGSLCHSDAKFYSTLPLKWSDGPVKVLGMNILSDYQSTLKHNFDSTLEKVKNILNVWRTRMLTVLGKICVVNTLINSQVIYKLQSLPTPPQKFFHDYKKLVCDFIWENKKARIAYHRLIASYSNGGLQLRDLVLTDMSLKMAKVHKIITGGDQAFWCQYFSSAFGLSPREVFKCNFSAKHVKKYIPHSVFRDMCTYWAQLNYHHPKTVNQILQQPIWYNSHILSNGKWIFNELWHQCGINKIIDLFDLDTGGFYEFAEFSRLNPRLNNFILYHKIVLAIPKLWKEILTHNLPSEPQPDTWPVLFEKN